MMHVWDRRQVLDRHARRPDLSCYDWSGEHNGGKTQLQLIGIEKGTKAKWTVYNPLYMNFLFVKVAVATPTLPPF